MSKRFGVLLQTFPSKSVLRANVTVLIARPDDLAKSCGLIGPSLSNLSITINVLLVRLMGTLMLTTLQREIYTGYFNPISCQYSSYAYVSGKNSIYILPIT